MHRIDEDAVVNITSSHGVTPVNGFSEGDPTVPRQGTQIADTWLNALQEEIMTILDAALIAPVKGTWNQLLAALRVLFVDMVSNQNAIGGNKNFTGNVSVQGDFVADNGSHILGGAVQIDGNIAVVGNQSVAGTSTLGVTTMTAPTPIAVFGGIGYLTGADETATDYEGAHYWKNAQGEKALAGMVKTVTSLSAMFQLPDGYRPTVTRTFSVGTNTIGHFAQVLVDKNGFVTPVFSNAGDHISLDGIRFY